MRCDNALHHVDKYTRKDRFPFKPLRRPFEPTQHDLMAAQCLFPPNFLHETWCDYLYWDVELEK